MIITKDTPPELIEAKLNDVKERVKLEETLHELNNKILGLKKGKTIKELNAYLHESSLRSVWGMLTRSSKSLLSLMNSNGSRLRGKTTNEKLDILNQQISILSAIVIKQTKSDSQINELAMTEYE